MDPLVSQPSCAQIIEETSIPFTGTSPLQVAVRRAAVMLGISRMTLYRMRERGEINFGCYRGKAMVSTAELMRVHKLMSGGQPNSLGCVPECIPKIHRPKKVKLNQLVK